MRNMKKFLTLALAVLMVMSAFATGASAKFTDVDANNEALTEAVELLAGLNVTKGTTDTTFGPKELVTRQQMAAFVYRLMKAGKSVEGGNNTSTFTDLKDSTFFYMVSWANTQGIIKGRSATSFDPTGSIILQDAYVMIVRALGYEKNEALPYPYGYIDIAEEIGLDENLDSAVSYDTPLTRGDIAILLYNAFYASMNEKTTDYVEKTLSDGSVQLIAKEVSATVAEKIFKVEKTVMRVVATPNYSFDNYAKTGSEVQDVDIVTLSGVSFDYESVTDFAQGGVANVEFEDLGLSGKADDYFLSDLTLFIKDGEVLTSQSNLVTYTGAKAESILARVSGTEDKDYYSATKEDWNKKITGYVTVGALKGYFFNAPYSFASKANNTQLIQLAGNAGNTSEEPDSYHFVSNKDAFGKTVNYTQDGLIANLAQVRYDGYYEMTAYDCDGNGFIDYIWYKPYTFGKMVSLDDEDANDEYIYTTEKQHTGDYAIRAIGNDGLLPTEFSGEPVIFTKEAKIEGKEFVDGNYVVAYVNGPANYIKVADVVKPTEAKVTKYIPDNSGIGLSSGTTTYLFDTSARILGHMSVGGGQETLANEDARTNTFDGSPVRNLGTEGTFYLYGGKLLYFDLKHGGLVSNDENFAIIQYYEAPSADDADGKIIFTAGGIVDGVLKIEKYVQVYMDGAIKAVKISEEDGNEVVYNDDCDYLYENYLGKLATYEVDSDNVYTFTYVDPTVKQDLTNTKDETLEYRASLGNNVKSTFEKISGNVYRFTPNAANAAPYNTAIIPCDYVAVQEFTQIIIKSLDEDGEEIFTQYSASNLPNFDSEGTDKVEFKNIQYRILNNPSTTTIENLAVLYAEVDGVTNVGTDETAQYRIVRDNYQAYDENNKIANYYSVYNPFTGAIENDVKGTDNGTVSAKAPILSIYEAAGGKLKTSVPAYGTLTGLKEIVNSYDSASKLVEIGGKLYKVNSDTVISFIDTGDKTIKKVDASIFNTTSATYLQDDGTLTAYIEHEKNDDTTLYEDLVYAVVFRP